MSFCAPDLGDRSVFAFSLLACAAPKDMWGPASMRPADPQVILNSHEVVDHLQTKGSSYPARTDGSPTPNLFERTKEVSNRKKKKKGSTATCILPHPPSASSPIGPSGAWADACSKCASLVWDAFWESRRHGTCGELLLEP